MREKPMRERPIDLYDTMIYVRDSTVLERPFARDAYLREMPSLELRNSIPSKEASSKVHPFRKTTQQTHANNYI